MGGLGIPIFGNKADIEFSNSTKLTSKLQQNIESQIREHDVDQNSTKKIKGAIQQQKKRRNEATKTTTRSEMDANQNRLDEINCEKGASIWLTTLPIKDEGFSIDKTTFWDLIKLRYGKQLDRLPTRCVCGSDFNIQHALSCKKGGFVTLRHNILRNTTATLLSEVCKDVTVEPVLAKLTGEKLSTSSNTSDGARLDISARGFWISGQKAFFDVRVFNPKAGRYEKQSLAKCYEINEREKKRSYNERIQQCDQGSFTPLVFSANGGYGRECKTFYKRLADMLAEKRKQPVEVISS